MQWYETQRERERERSIYTSSSQKSSSLVPLHFQQIFTIITKNYKYSSTQERDLQCSITQEAAKPPHSDM